VLGSSPGLAIQAAAPAIMQRVSLDAVNEALERLAAGAAAGRLVMT
jgi:hypothetical protein